MPVVGPQKLLQLLEILAERSGLGDGVVLRALEPARVARVVIAQAHLRPGGDAVSLFGSLHDEERHAAWCLEAVRGRGLMNRRRSQAVEVERACRPVGRRDPPCPMT